MELYCSFRTFVSFCFDVTTFHTSTDEQRIYCLHTTVKKGFPSVLGQLNSGASGTEIAYIGNMTPLPKVGLILAVLTLWGDKWMACSYSYEPHQMAINEQVSCTWGFKYCTTYRNIWIISGIQDAYIHLVTRLHYWLTTSEEKKHPWPRFNANWRYNWQASYHIYAELGERECREREGGRYIT